jgi:hypothetical protein
VGPRGLVRIDEGRNGEESKGDVGIVQTEADDGYGLEGGGRQEGEGET